MPSIHLPHLSRRESGFGAFARVSPSCLSMLCRSGSVISPDGTLWVASPCRGSRARICIRSVSRRQLIARHGTGACCPSGVRGYPADRLSELLLNLRRLSAVEPDRIANKRSDQASADQRHSNDPQARVGREGCVVEQKNRSNKPTRKPRQ